MVAYATLSSNEFSHTLFGPKPTPKGEVSANRLYRSTLRASRPELHVSHTKPPPPEKNEKLVVSKCQKE